MLKRKTSCHLLKKKKKLIIWPHSIMKTVIGKIIIVWHVILIIRQVNKVGVMVRQVAQKRWTGKGDHSKQCTNLKPKTKQEKEERRSPTKEPRRPRPLGWGELLSLVKKAFNQKAKGLLGHMANITPWRVFSKFFNLVISSLTFTWRQLRTELLHVPRQFI